MSTELNNDMDYYIEPLIFQVHPSLQLIEASH
jgi:hypothetical protein